MPYQYAKAIEATETGVPVMRSMVMEPQFVSPTGSVERIA